MSETASIDFNASKEELIKQVENKTHEHIIIWEPTSDADTFLTILSNGLAQILPVEETEKQQGSGYALQLFAPNGKMQFTITDADLSGENSVTQLYKEARRASFGMGRIKLGGTNF